MRTMDEATVVIKTTFHVPVEKVWQAWTNPALIMRWFGSDPHGSVSKAVLDVRTGGHFEITFNDSDKTEHTCSGIYKDVEKFRKLTFSWMWKSEPGFESSVCLLLIGEGNATHMQFTHSDLWHESKHSYEQGWRGAFSKLEKILEASV